MKKDNLYMTGNKYKLGFTITTIQSLCEMKALVCILDHSISFKITDISGNNQDEKLKRKELVKGLMMPIYFSETEETFFINYSLIKRVGLEGTKLVLEVFNPGSPSSIIIVLFKIENVGMLFNKVLNHEGLLMFSRGLDSYVQHEIKMQIEKFLLCFRAFRERISFFDTGRGLDEKFSKSLSAGRKYYDKSIVELKKTDKLKHNLKKKIKSKAEKAFYAQPNKSWNKSGNDNSGNKSQNKSGILEGINNNLSNIDNNTSINLTNNYTESIIYDNNEIHCYHTFDFIANEVKLKAIPIIEDSIDLFFQIMSLENTLINLKKVNKEKVSNQLNQLKNLDKDEVDNNNKVNKSQNNSGNNIDGLSISMRDVTDTSVNKSINDEPKNVNPRQRSHSNNLKNVEEKEVFSNVSTKTNSIKDSEKNGAKGSNFKNNLKGYVNKDNYAIDTPKFCSKNNNTPININANKEKRSSISVSPITPSVNSNNRNSKLNTALVAEERHDEIDTHHQILKNIELAKFAHSFLPTNSILNIFQNTLEVTHRKFFEFCFTDFFPKIFSIDKDSNGLIKLESLFNFFLFLRGLKNMLFTDKNKIFFSNIFFTADGGC